MENRFSMTGEVERYKKRWRMRECSTDVERGTGGNQGEGDLTVEGARTKLVPPRKCDAHVWRVKRNAQFKRA